MARFETIDLRPMTLEADRCDSASRTRSWAGLPIVRLVQVSDLNLDVAVLVIDRTKVSDVTIAGRQFR